MKELKIHKFKTGVLSEPINIKRRSYLYLKTEGNLGEGINFVLVFLKDGKKFAEY